MIKKKTSINYKNIFIVLLVIAGIVFVFGQTQQTLVTQTWNQCVSGGCTNIAMCEDDPSQNCLVSGIGRFVADGQFIYDATPPITGLCTGETIIVTNNQGQKVDYCVWKTPRVICDQGKQAWVSESGIYARCEFGVTPAYCGDGKVDVGEECEPPQQGNCNKYCQLIETPEPADHSLTIIALVLIGIVLGGLVYLRREGLI